MGPAGPGLCDATGARRKLVGAVQRDRACRLLAADARQSTASKLPRPDPARACDRSRLQPVDRAREPLLRGRAPPAVRRGDLLRTDPRGGAAEALTSPLLIASRAARRPSRGRRGFAGSA